MFKIFKRKGKETKERSLRECYELSRKLYDDFDLLLLYFRGLEEHKKELVDPQIEIFIRNGEFNLAYLRDALKIGLEQHLQRTAIEKLKKVGKDE